MYNHAHKQYVYKLKIKEEHVIKYCLSNMCFLNGWLFDKNVIWSSWDKRMYIIKEISSEFIRGTIYLYNKTNLY